MSEFLVEDETYQLPCVARIKGGSYGWERFHLCVPVGYGDKGEDKVTCFVEDCIGNRCDWKMEISEEVFAFERTPLASIVVQEDSEKFREKIDTIAHDLANLFTGLSNEEVRLEMSNGEYIFLGKGND